MQRLKGIGYSGLQISFPCCKDLEGTLFIRIWEPLGDHEKAQFTILFSDPPVRCLHIAVAFCSPGLEDPKDKCLRQRHRGDSVEQEVRPLKGSCDSGPSRREGRRKMLCLLTRLRSMRPTDPKKQIILPSVGLASSKKTKARVKHKAHPPLSKRFLPAW